MNELLFIVSVSSSFLALGAVAWLFIRTRRLEGRLPGPDDGPTLKLGETSKGQRELSHRLGGQLEQVAHSVEKLTGAFSHVHELLEKILRNLEAMRSATGMEAHIATIEANGSRIVDLLQNLDQDIVDTRERLLGSFSRGQDGSLQPRPLGYESQGTMAGVPLQNGLERLIELYNSDPKQFRAQANPRVIGVENAIDVFRDPRTVPRFKEMSVGNIWLFTSPSGDQRAVPVYRSPVTSSMSQELGCAFDLKDYRQGMRYRSARLIQPAAIEKTHDSWRIVARGAIQLVDGEPEA